MFNPINLNGGAKTVYNNGFTDYSKSLMEKAVASGDPQGYYNNGSRIVQDL